MNAPSSSFGAGLLATPQTSAPPSGRLIAALLLGCCTAFLPARAQLYTEHTTLATAGNTVAADGDTLVVGTSSAEPHGGAYPPAYVFVRGTTGWTLQQTLAVATNDIAIDGNTLVAGGIPYVRSGTTWTAQAMPFTMDHPRPALQGDTLVLGEPSDPTQEYGLIFVFTRNGSTWSHQSTLSPDSNAGAHDMMGNSVALDGDTILAGVNSGTGGAYVFVRSGTTWTRQARLVLPTGAGWGMKVALEGDTAAVSDPANNKIYIFTRSGTTWTLGQTLDVPDAGRDFGYKLSLDGDILAAGTDTAFFVYARTASGWVLAQTVIPSGYGFEGGMVLANNGKLLVTGNPYASSNGVDIYSVPPPPAPGSGWRDTDIGAVGVAGGSAIMGAAGSVGGSGTDIWDRGDQFHFRSETLTGDGAIIARVTSAGTTNPWAKVGLMFREDIAPSARTVMALVTPGPRIGLQSRVATADTTNFVDAGWVGAPIWLMLARTGDHFDAFRSDNGSNWTLLGSATVSMPATIHVGLAVSSHDNTALNTGTFSWIELVGSTPPPPPPDTLSGSDLGSVAVAGTFTNASGTLTIDAAGSDIWDQADSGYFIHRDITGDFDLRARVTSLTNTHSWAKAGVMVRESLDAGARNLFTMISADAASGLQVRDTTGAATTFSSGPWVHAPFWVRLARTGNSFQAYVSPDGTTWQSVGTQTLALPATLQAGVAVSSHVANTTTHVTVDSLQFGD